MEAFCQAAAMRFDSCSESLAEGFQDNDAIATKLQNAFISFHVGIREEGINSLIELVNERNDLPTVCFLLGEMLMKVDRPDMVKKCWALAIERDRKAGRGGCRCSSADQMAIGDFSRRARAAESGEPLNGNILSSQQHFVAPRQIVR